MPARPPGVWRAQGSLPSSARAAPGRSCTCSQGGGRVAGGAPVGGGARGGAQHAAQRRDGGTPRTLCRGRGAQVGTALDSGQGACTTLAPPLLLSPPAQPADGGGQPGRPRGARGPGQAVFRGRWVVGGGGGGRPRAGGASARRPLCVWQRVCGACMQASPRGSCRHCKRTQPSGWPWPRCSASLQGGGRSARSTAACRRRARGGLLRAGASVRVPPR